MSHTADFTPFRERMEAEGIAELAICTFAHYYGLLAGGETGLIGEEEIACVASLPDYEALSDELSSVGRGAQERTVVIKLNGGLGTGMGLDKAKSLLKVKEGLTFLDIIAAQAIKAGSALVLMNSFNTRLDSLEALEKYPQLGLELALDFMQHKVPKVCAATLEPAVWPKEPRLQWCPPGHGDIYTALITSGMLQGMLDAGFEVAFVSNADNLGAVLDERILGHFVSSGLPFMMEVADRTPVDKKGGHLALRPDGQLILRERAQCPAEDLGDFEDVSIHRYFNTNSLWIDLKALSITLEARGHVLGLPMIRNQKHLDPRDETSARIYQLETAMGSAIAVFEGAGALRVPRTRFAPVKTCQDLLQVRSDAFTLTSDHRVIPTPGAPVDEQEISLDPSFYKKVSDLELRFPHGPPSLVGCRRLRVEGDVRFGADVVVRADATLINESDEPAFVEDGAILEGTRRW